MPFPKGYFRSCSITPNVHTWPGWAWGPLRASSGFLNSHSNHPRGRVFRRPAWLLCHIVTHILSESFGPESQRSSPNAQDLSGPRLHEVLQACHEQRRLSRRNSMPLSQHGTPTLGHSPTILNKQQYLHPSRAGRKPYRGSGGWAAGPAAWEL